jgi:hypothetical protein
MSSRPEIEGYKILKRIHTRDKDHGGVLSETTGAMGGTKTSVLLSFTKHTQINHPEEKIFWSENYDAPLQIFKLGDPSKYQFFVKEGSNVVFRNRDKKLKVEKLGERYFKDYDDLWEMTEPGIANVVFFKDRYEWMDFLKYLSGIGNWVNIFIDEMGDISPSQTGGELWKKIEEFAKTMKGVRRCMMNVHCNTQSVVDVDYRIRSKIMMKIYLPGARSDKTSRVTQKAIDNLTRDPINGNEAFIEYSGTFGKVRFGDIYKPLPGFHYEAHVEGEE